MTEAPGQLEFLRDDRTERVCYLLRCFASVREDDTRSRKNTSPVFVPSHTLRSPTFDALNPHC